MFKQKTAYEMRISDWSSDVCSSDLDVADRLLAFSRVRSTGHDDALAKLDALGVGTPLFEEGRGELRELLGRLKAMGVPESRYATNLSRSDERRVGQECVRTCRSRWSPVPEKKKTTKRSTETK